jgi:hypothetical protein
VTRILRHCARHGETEFGAHRAGERIPNCHGEIEAGVIPCPPLPWGA